MKRNNVFTILVFLVLVSTLCINNVSAQKNNKKIAITGTVLDADKNPVVNAIVMVDGVKTNSMTDANGKYKVKVKPTALKIGIFTFGNGMSEEAIDGKTLIDFNFGTASAQQAQDKEVAPGDEGVNSGYAYVKKKNLANQISKIDGTKSKYASYTSIEEMIRREFGGITGRGDAYYIQGSKNLAGPVPALLVLDGVYVSSFEGVSPTDVESIEVLKASSAAMYGSRGYGGVILLKTKIQNK